MKKIMYLLMFCVSVKAFAQQGINYKALIKDTNGNALVNTSVDIRLSVTKESGTEVFTETHSVTTTSSGFALVFIGEGSATYGLFDDISWGDENFQLKVELDIEQDGSFIDFGVSPFKYVPYAKVADVAKEALNAQNAQLANQVSVMLKPYILGRTDVTSTGRFAFNGKTGWAAAQKMCEASYPNDPNVRAFTLEEINKALVLESYDTNSLHKINDIRFWAITPVTYGATYNFPHQNNSMALNGNSSYFSRGTTGAIYVNAPYNLNHDLGNTTNTYLAVHNNVANHTNLPVMCGTYKN